MSFAPSLKKLQCMVVATIVCVVVDGAAAVSAKRELTTSKIASKKTQRLADAASPKKLKTNAKSVVMVGGLEWRTDYNAAYQAAKKSRRMLLINVTDSSADHLQAIVERHIASSARLHQKLQRVERLRLPSEAEITVDGKPQRLLSFAAFSQLEGGPGFVLIDLQNRKAEHYGHAVNVLPYANGKYYRWNPSHLNVILDLPAGTLTQRTMIWAVRTHPEAPQSTYGAHHPTLADGAASHSSYQASIGVQGHQNFDSRFHQLSGAAGGHVSEVVAESWPGQNMIDSCIDCVQSWRGSSGHWRGVSRRHRAFGYDIRRGRNGIWYGTGIFAD